MWIDGLMKKIICLLFVLCVSTINVFAPRILSEADSPRGTFALTTGYLFKNDCRFKEVYGHGMQNIITADLVSYPWNFWGMGLKASYLHAIGKTTFLQFCTKLQEVPLTFSFRRLLVFKHNIEMYASLGGGFTWIHEKSYLECIKMYKGIGDVEVGFNYPIYKCLKLTTAFRYLFPPQCFCRLNIDVGGVDLRAGFLFEF